MAVGATDKDTRVEMSQSLKNKTKCNRRFLGEFSFVIMLTFSSLFYCSDVRINSSKHVWWFPSSLLQMCVMSYKHFNVILLCWNDKNSQTGQSGAFEAVGRMVMLFRAFTFILIDSCKCVQLNAAVDIPTALMNSTWGGRNGRFQTCNPTDC